MEEFYTLLGESILALLKVVDINAVAPPIKTKQPTFHFAKPIAPMLCKYAIMLPEAIPPPALFAAQDIPLAASDPPEIPPAPNPIRFAISGMPYAAHKLARTHFKIGWKTIFAFFDPWHLKVTE
uniref:AlNc14C19G2030 protein n=1 Tax=Albugo laibachii Nc14 TaxID=890382 RepID=F0W559_9STRA|nr:AlNc14C19G2030 [Albugo laibachii Nc14]|eukprot:CCA16250.1 AlNc14C19G2030 [Albugo laibachii Nc14]